MTQYSPRTRKRRRLAGGQQIHIPHSSWSRVERAPERTAPVEPEDFWSRLGL
ncbi:MULTISPECIES: hypothetical protein [Sphingobium]|uniref:hypothetical protein n=1 Tax=Sphingobium TaxID=165695 RepID=UPI000A870CB6|nr:MULTISPECIES: hypothetical protein [Sphingobium]